MAWHRGIPSTHGRVRNQIGGFQWYWHRWISSLAVRICRYRWSHFHLRALQAVQHLGLYILVHGLDVVALPSVAKDGPVKLAASVLPVEQTGGLDGTIVPAHEQHRRGAGQHDHLAGSAQPVLNGPQAVGQGRDHRIFAQFG